MHTHVCTIFAREIPHVSIADGERRAHWPAAQRCMSGGRATCRGVWKKAQTMGASRVLAMSGNLSKICVLTRPGLTAYEVMRRSSADSRRCSSSTWSTLHSFDLAYCMNLHRRRRLRRRGLQVGLHTYIHASYEPLQAWIQSLQSQQTFAGLPCRRCSFGQARWPMCLLPLMGMV